MTDTAPPRRAIMERLKAETQDLHTRAERRPLQRALLKGSIARSLYVAYLGQLLCVHRTLEDQLRIHRSRHPAFEVVVQPHQFRENDLRSDLMHHRTAPDDIDALPATNRLVHDIQQVGANEPVALLGMLYVLEGSNNGSMHIARSLMRAHGLKPGAGLRYLNPYGDEQEARWEQFKRNMDDAGFNDDEMQRITAAAMRMFQGIIEISDAVYESAHEPR